MYSRVQGRFGHAAVWSGTSIPVAITIALAVLPALPARAAVAAGTQHRIKTVTYLGHSFEVPRGWRVINLAQHPRTCVRFDRHTMYLGTPAANEACPSSIVGTTEAMLIEPASRGAAPQAAENVATRRITVTGQRLHIVATFRRHPGQIRQILSRAGLGRALHEDPARAERAALDAPLPAGATSYRGLGFDTCTAPSEAAMSAWRAHSPYRAIGIYLGGSDVACAQPNLSQSWLTTEAAQGWHFLPLYVGPQAAFGELSKSSAGQGTAAANDAAAQAERLGFGPQTPIYYDMEAYRGHHQSPRVVQFLAAWTTRLHQLGFLSGVYSSSLSGIAALSRQTGSYQAPDVIFDALWNGQANTQDPVLHAGQWGHHHRVHQYNGNVTQKFGGTAIDIDQDYLDVELLAKPSRATIDYPAGAAATEYTGPAFDTCSAPSLHAMAAWRAHSRFRAIGVYIGGINRRCGQPNLTAKWVTAVSAAAGGCSRSTSGCSRRAGTARRRGSSPAPRRSSMPRPRAKAPALPITRPGRPRHWACAAGASSMTTSRRTRHPAPAAPALCSGSSRRGPVNCTGSASWPGSTCRSAPAGRTYPASTPRPHSVGRCALGGQLGREPGTDRVGRHRQPPVGQPPAGQAGYWPAQRDLRRDHHPHRQRPG